MGEDTEILEDSDVTAFHINTSHVGVVRLV